MGIPVYHRVKKFAEAIADRTLCHRLSRRNSLVLDSFPNERFRRSNVFPLSISTTLIAIIRSADVSTCFQLVGENSPNTICNLSCFFIILLLYQKYSINVQSCFIILKLNEITVFFSYIKFAIDVRV